MYIDGLVAMGGVQDDREVHTRFALTRGCGRMHGPEERPRATALCQFRLKRTKLRPIWLGTGQSGLAACEHRQRTVASARVERSKGLVVAVTRHVLAAS